MKINGMVSTFICIVCIMVTAACGGPTITPELPPEIAYGEDVCDQCNMIISDERYAAGLVVEVEPGRYEHRIFDDIGDLLVYEQEHVDELTVAAYYVHDYGSKEWIDGRSAFYISSDELLTPMGLGLAAAAQAAASVTVRRCSASSSAARLARRQPGTDCSRLRT